MQNDQNNSQPLVAPKSDVGGSTLHPSTSFAAPVRLKYFSQPEILQQIGIARLFKFLDEYADDLEVANILLPTPVSESDDHFDSLAALLASPGLLPERLRTDLLALEEAAAPENRDRLQAAIAHRIPSVSLANCCPLDCALELWFAAPDELSQIEALVGPLPPAGAPESSIEHPESRIESPAPPPSTINSPTLNSVAPTVGPLPPAGAPFDVRCSMFDVKCSSSAPSTINAPTLNHSGPSTLAQPTLPD